MRSALLLYALLLCGCPTRVTRLSWAGVAVTGEDEPWVAIGALVSEQPVPGSAGEFVEFPPNVYLFKLRRAGASLEQLHGPPQEVPLDGATDGGAASDPTVVRVFDDGKVVLRYRLDRQPQELGLLLDGGLVPVPVSSERAAPPHTFPSAPLLHCPQAAPYFRQAEPRARFSPDGHRVVLVRESFARDFAWDGHCAESIIQVARFLEGGQLDAEWELRWNLPVSADPLRLQAEITDDGAILLADSRATVERLPDGSSGSNFRYTSLLTRLTAIDPAGILREHNLDGAGRQLVRSGNGWALLLERTNAARSANDLVTLDRHGNELGRIGVREGTSQVLTAAPTGATLVQGTSFDEHLVEFISVGDDGRVRWRHSVDLLRFR